MRSSLILRCVSAVCVTALSALFCAAPSLHAQGGEPQYFAIRGAKVVPVSGPPVENATIVISRGLITAIGREVIIPPEAWVIEGKGLTVYPGLFNSFPDVGIPAAPPASGETGPRRPQEGARGPEDRPASTPWRSAADEVSLSDKRIETWRSAGFTTAISRAARRNFPGTGGGAGSGGRTRRRSGGEIAGGDSGGFPDFGRTRRRVSQFDHGRARLRSSGLAGHGVEHQRAGHLRKESSRRGAAAV